MTTFDVVTTFARHHWDTHAQRCVESFKTHWSSSLRTFEDEELEERSAWLSAFKKRHQDKPTTNYRFDAVRFAHKVAAIELAYVEGMSDVLIWMDADCVTHSPVTTAWLEGLLKDADFAYLKRARKYPECGFMMFRRNETAAKFVADVVEQYETDALFRLAEWHDSYVIEHVRAQSQMKCMSLSGDAENSGHPLVNGPLGACLDHLKGKRKAVGKSHKADLVNPRNEPYWKWQNATNN